MSFLSKAKGDDLDDMMPARMGKKSSGKNLKEIAIAKGLKDAEVRHSCYLTTDKQKYKPGETVHIRAVFLNSFTHKPCQKLLENTKLTFAIKSADGSVVAGGNGIKLPDPQNSVSAISWKIPSNQTGGEYSIHVEQEEYPPLEKLISVPKEGEVAEPETPVTFTFDRKTASNVTISGNSIEKTGKRNMWDNIVRIPLNSNNKIHRFRININRSHGGGIYFGFAGKNAKRVNHQSQCYGAPCGTPNWENIKSGSKYEVVCDIEKDKIEVFKNGSLLCVNTKKPSQLKPEFFNVHLYFKNDKITFEGKSGFIAPAVRKFDVESFRAPKFKMDLNFLRKGYGIGDTVKARLKVERSEGGFPEKGTVEATARVDGTEIFRKSLTIDPKDGLCFIQFKLPEKIEEGMGSLSCAVTEGITENTSKTIPIILRKLDCKLFPECGEMVYGLNNGVYFEAKTLTGDPADFHGLVYKKKDGKESICQLIKTSHEGRGYFAITPEKGHEYYINVIKPEGVTVPIPFPKIKEAGLTMMLKEKKSIEFGKDIQVAINTTEEVTVKIGLFKKEKPLHWTDVLRVQAGKETIVNLPPKNVDGVLRVTLFYLNPWFGVDKLEYPISERLVFVKPVKELDFKIKTKKTDYTPGETVELTVETHMKGTSNGVNATLGVTIVDDSVIKMTSKRKRLPRLLEMVYFEDEVLELKDPEAYFHPKVEKGLEFVNADVSVDLLLGSQGWRRYIYKFFNKDKSFFKKEEKFKNIDKQKLFRILNIPDPDKQVVIPPPPDIDELGWDSEDSDDNDDGWGNTRSYKVRKPRKMKEKKKRKKKGKGGFKLGSRGRGRGRGDLFGNIRSGGFKLKKVSTGSRNRAPPPRAMGGGMELMGLLKSSLSSRKSSFGGGPPRREKEERKKDSRRLIPKMMMQQSAPKRMQVMEKEDLDGDWDDEEEEQLEIEESLDDYIVPSKKKVGYFNGRGRYNQKKAYIRDVDVPQYQTISYAKEYAHETRKGKKPDERDDFVECIYFAPYILCKKKHTIKFDLNDSITSFCVFIDAWTENGILGQSRGFMINSRKPFYITPKIPLEISFKDQVKMPVAIVNNLQKGITCGVDLTSDKILNIQTKKWEGKLKQKQRIVKYFDYNVTSSYIDKKDNYITLEAKVKEFSLKDKVKKTIIVKPYGFPLFFNFSGNLKPNGKVDYEFEVPKDFVSNSMETQAYVIPSNLGSFESSLKGLIREPYGCFEQVSSTMYPMVMAVNYFNNNEKDLDQNLYNKIDKHIASGYKKLKGYECKKSGGGFDWYGRPPANESLTAMGLVQFIELANVFPVDRNLIERTKKWLLSRRTDSGFKRNSGRYAYGHAPDDTVNSYILWCMSNAGVTFDQVEKQMSALHKKVQGSRDVDCYVIGLLALAFYNYGKEKLSKELLTRLVPHLEGNGAISKAKSTITRSGGNNKTLECTAIAALGWMNFGDDFGDAIGKAMDFILKNNRAGRYGSTQSTVLCIKAVLEYFSSSGPEDGSVELHMNGAPVSTKLVKKTDCKMIEFDDFKRNIGAGKKNKLSIVSKIGKSLPFTVVIACKVGTPPSDLGSLPFTFANTLSNTKLKEGDSTEVEVHLKNKNAREPLAMIIARVCLPAGLEVRVEKLKELKKMGKFEYYELFGPREVVFYWYGMKANDEYKFRFDCIAAIPGKYLGDCSRAYLYYDDDNRYYVEGLSCEIIPKGN